MAGDILKATSDAILEAIEDQTLPQNLRDAAKAILQGPQGMTDYRRHMGQTLFDAVKMTRLHHPWKAPLSFCRQDLKKPDWSI